MQKKIKVLASVICSCALLATGMVLPVVSADEHYNVYNYDRWNEATPSQAGYEATRAVSGTDLGCGEMDVIHDIFRDSQNQFYVVDSGNERIVVVNEEFTEAVREYSEFKDSEGNILTLSAPEGVFVSEDTGYMYIADTGNSRMLVTDMDGNVVMNITRPDSTLYENETFKPQKIVVDKAGNIYAVLNNITNGAAFFNSSGEFQGYYGANAVEATAEVVAGYFWNLIATDEMRANSSRNVAAGITNFDIDDEGFVFTVTQSSSSESDRVKKVNPSGVNLFTGLDVTFGDLASMYDETTNQTFSTKLIDIDIDDIGRLNCLDMETGRVFQYDEDGNLLFIMGTRSDQLGGFSLQPTAIETMGSNIYVTDGLKNTITIFEETDFGEIVHEAVDLYNDGYYEEALAPWYEVLKRDGNYRAAYVGISSALLNQGDYEGAMKYAELAESSLQYNKAFEGYRSEWLDENFTIVVIVIIVLIVLYVVYRHHKKKKMKNQPKNLVEMLHEGEEE